jgi:plasmid stabilization system protein ParE
VRVELSPEANATFLNIQSEYRATNKKLARDFAAEVRRIGAELRRFPQMGMRVGRLRRMILHRFLYLILYEIGGALIRITSILHQKQRPTYLADDEVEEDEEE